MNEKVVWGNNRQCDVSAWCVTLSGNQ